MHLGILGGGQLARMLAESALRRGHLVSVTSASKPTSASIPEVEVIPQPADDREALEALIARGATCVTIENEFLDTQSLARCLAAHPHVQFFPQPDSIAVAQDKLAQKRLFTELSIPSAAFVLIDQDGIEGSLQVAGERFKEGFMLKWSRFGYDGKGNLLVTVSKPPSQDAITRFIRQAAERGATVYAEQLVSFEHELAMVATRSASEQFVNFPLVYSVQERSVCREVFGPCNALGLDLTLEETASEILRAIGDRLDFVGTFAVEFFLTRDGTLLASEMAPRVHNSGHYSLFAEAHSQFDAHIQALSGEPLSTPNRGELVLMRNFLGPAGSSRDVPCPRPIAALPDHSELYWYEKGGASEGRKMGHLTGRAHTPEALNTLRKQFEAYETQYWAQLRNEGM